ncbi:hypothetical protein ACU81Q_16455 [Komagataeibacter melomenusus]
MSNNDMNIQIPENDELGKFYNYMRERFGELREGSRGTAWDFIGLSASIEYLASLTKIRVRDTESRKMREQYGHEYFTKFVENYFPESYSSFTYKNGQQDLPEQMYRILRCGLAHAFSLYGDAKGRGRTGSIVIGHETGNLIPESLKPPRDDTVVLNFLPLLTDVEYALNRLIKNARNDLVLRERLLKRIREQPPLASITE